MRNPGEQYPDTGRARGIRCVDRLYSFAPSCGRLRPFVGRQFHHERTPRHHTGFQGSAAGVAARDSLADFLTVCWMLAVLTTLLCEVGAGVAALALTRYPDSRPVQTLADVLLFAALVVGLLTVAFMPILWRARTTPPPKPIAWLAAIAGLAPMVIMLARAVL